MGFKKIEKRGDKIAISLQRAGRTEDNYYIARVYISASLKRRLGWKHKTKIEVFIGFDDDLGKIQITKANNASKHTLSLYGFPKNMGGLWFLSSGLAVGDKHIPSKSAEYFLEQDGSLTITLPPEIQELAKSQEATP